MARRFSKLGATCILSSRKVPELERVKNSLTNPEKHMIFPMDFSKPYEVMAKSKPFIE